MRIAIQIFSGCPVACLAILRSKDGSANERAQRRSVANTKSARGGLAALLHYSRFILVS
jgi:hypothetical protein